MCIYVCMCMYVCVCVCAWTISSQTPLGTLPTPVLISVWKILGKRLKTSFLASYRAKNVLFAVGLLSKPRNKLKKLLFTAVLMLHEKNASIKLFVVIQLCANFLLKSHMSTYSCQEALVQFWYPSILYTSISFDI